MIGAYDSPPTLVDLTTTMGVWPGKHQNDIGWAYVTIAGKDWAEAVTSRHCKRKWLTCCSEPLNGVGHDDANLAMQRIALASDA